MTANFWLSQHYKKWLLTRDTVEQCQALDKQTFSSDEIFKLRVFYTGWLYSLGEALNLRQRVVATAIVYWRRFYLKQNFVEFEPRLLCTASIYLASKVEECNTRVTEVMDKAKRIHFECTVNEIAKCELYMLDALNCDLMIYHPYIILPKYAKSAGLGKEEMETIWKVLNDSYRTDLSLMYTPFSICLAAIYFAGVYVFGKSEEISQWVIDLNMDLTELSDIILELMKLYELWGVPYDEEIGVLVERAKKAHQENPNKPALT